jgi:hypothetical protein
MRAVTIVLFAFFSFFCAVVHSQVYMNFYANVATDLANNNQFQQLGIGWQSRISINNKFQFFVQVQYVPPLLSREINKPAFTANPLLPLQITVAEKISPTQFAVALGHCFLLGRSSAVSSWHLVLLTGYGVQGFRAKASVPESYALLNAEIKQSVGGLFAGLGAEWQYDIGKKSRLYVQLGSHIYPFNPTFKSPSVYKNWVPLQLSVGYGIKTSKK